MTILELLYKHNKQLREYTVAEWNETHALGLSYSEWNCLNAIMSGANTTPQIMQRNEITKQAAHKVIKALEEKELIITNLIKAPKVQRQIEVTNQGVKIYNKSLQVQNEVESMIENNLGAEAFQQLQHLLNRKWL